MNGDPIVIGTGNLHRAQRAQVAAIIVTVRVQTAGSTTAPCRQQQGRASQSRIGHRNVTSIRLTSSSPPPLRVRRRSRAAHRLRARPGDAHAGRHVDDRRRPRPDEDQHRRGLERRPGGRIRGHRGVPEPPRQRLRPTRSTATQRTVHDGLREHRHASRPEANPAFGIGTAGTWAIPAADGPPAVPVQASYRYEIDNTTTRQGHPAPRSTGRVGDVTRSMVADLKQDGFIDYLWFTNYEVSDPAYKGVTTVDSNNKNVCERYAYGTPGAATATCGDDPVRHERRLRAARCAATTACASARARSTVRSSPRARPRRLPDPERLLRRRSTSAPARSTRPRSTCRRPTPSSRRRSATTCPPRCRAPAASTRGRRSSPCSPTADEHHLAVDRRRPNVAATRRGRHQPGGVRHARHGRGRPGQLHRCHCDVLNLNLIYVQKVPAAGRPDANAPATSAHPCRPPSPASPATAGRTSPGLEIRERFHDRRPVPPRVGDHAIRRHRAAWCTTTAAGATCTSRAT